MPLKAPVTTLLMAATTLGISEDVSILNASLQLVIVS